MFLMEENVTKLYNNIEIEHLHFLVSYQTFCVEAFFPSKVFSRADGFRYFPCSDSLNVDPVANVIKPRAKNNVNINDIHIK